MISDIEFRTSNLAGEGGQPSRNMRPKNNDLRVAVVRVERIEAPTEVQHRWRRNHHDLAIHELDAAVDLSIN